MDWHFSAHLHRPKTAVVLGKSKGTRIYGARTKVNKRCLHCVQDEVTPTYLFVLVCKPNISLASPRSEKKKITKNGTLRAESETVDCRVDCNYQYKKLFCVLSGLRN